MLKSAIPLLISSFMITQSIYAGSIRISPVQINLINQNNASLSLINESATLSNLQIRVFKWEQNDIGQDILTATDEIAVSPPALKMQSNSAYNIRIIKTQALPLDVERAYRIIIDELPSPYDSRKVENGLQVLVRTSLPLFVVKKEAFSDLSAQFVMQNNQPMIAVKNQGSRHELIQSLILDNTTTKKSIEIPVNTINGYVLSGKIKYFPINAEIDQSTSKIVLKSNNRTKTF